MEVPQGKKDQDREQDSSPAIEEDEVPYYTSRKKLADKKDATVDYEDNKNTLIKRGKLGGEEGTWHLREAGVSIKLNSEAVQQPVPFTCRCLLWNPRTLSPPLASDEILVSSVIELSHDGPPDLEYRESVEGLSITVALLHSAPNLEGYEVVIKQLTDQKNNEWKELKTENTWHGSETSTVPRWLFPFAQAVCTKSGVSSFAAIWRPKSFTFSRGTAVGPEMTCIVPDFPDVSVQIPQSCVPVNQDFCVTIQVQEFPSSELKGEEGLVGPVLYISDTQNVSLIAPVTIRIPLTLRKGKQELAKLCPGELRILHCESLAEPHDWKDITDQLDEPPRLLDGKVQFKVTHFSRFRPVKLSRSRLKSASDLSEFVRKLCSRSRPQYARFFTCLCETSIRGHFGLKLFCYPQKLEHDVNQQISRCIVPYIGEGSSCEPVCEEEKILVSLSEAIIPQSSDEKNALQFVRFRENEVYDTGGEVCLGSVSVPKVKFNNQSQELLCNVTMVLASQVPVTVDHEEGSDFLRGISAQSVTHSIVKHLKSESSSCSPVAASGKRKQYIYMVKDGKPSDRELEELSLKLGKKWKELGSCLEFDDAAITNLDEDNKELARKAYRMLLAWKQREGFQATYTVLYNALCDKLVECKLLAENFCCIEIEENASP
ncbi:uncharacterized protein [Pocillopora verrucosa]|uniref:uncharacterized protein n=1 Tax=Pocillopora verrucosa TaxID=203993 RepID=UPI00333EDE5D